MPGPTKTWYKVVCGSLVVTPTGSYTFGMRGSSLMLCGLFHGSSSLNSLVERLFLDVRKNQHAAAQRRCAFFLLQIAAGNGTLFFHRNPWIAMESCLRLLIDCTLTLASRTFW